MSLAKFVVRRRCWEVCSNHFYSSTSLTHQSAFTVTAARCTVRRMAFAAVQQLEPLARGVISVAAAALTKMKANCADAPYVFEKGSGGTRVTSS